MIKVIAGIIKKDDKVLIARRKPGKSLSGKWEFPGGKLEQNETPEECLYREIIEELNIEIDVKDFLCANKYSYSHIEIELLVYNANFISGTIALNDHDKTEWVYVSDLDKYNFAEADIAIVSKIIKGELNVI